ncbi:uncharacterized protein LOC102459843 [Pelodiscus sinensis]|uniref:uncharacterized protein LOC102459843 n=1 Tax=Pelodiscus sinensis TaxID=13735 RepID=UPI003F6CD11D
MNTKKNLLGIFYKLNSVKRDTSLRRSGVQTPAQGTLQPSQAVASQSSQRMSEPSRVTSQQPSRVTSSQKPSQSTSQFSRVKAPRTSPVVASQFSRVVASQTSQGTSQPARVVVPQPSQATSQPSRVRASLITPPAPPIPTPTPPAQPCCRRLSNLLSRGPRRLQQCSSLLWERISNPEKNPFHLPRAKVAAESAGGAEGSRSTAKPLPPIQPPAAAASGSATTRAQPKSQVAPKSRAPPPKERNPRGAPQAGTGPLPNSHLCASLQQQQHLLQPQPPQQPRRLSPTRTRGRSVRNPGAAASPEPEAEVPAKQYNIILTTEATWLLMRRHLENQWGWINPLGSTGLLPGSQSRAGMDLTSLMKISLVNAQNRYDDEEYKEDPAPGVVNQELVHRCTEWLRGVEEARREGQLETVPYPVDP